MVSERTLPMGRRQLVRVLSRAGDVIRVGDVAEALDLDRTAAAKRLARWVDQGWLRRVGWGAYVAASIDTMDAERVLVDPWVLVPSLFAPAYVGGWTAAEHWDLTEQLFKDIFVMTTNAVRRTRTERQGAHFTLKHIAERRLFGTRDVWRGRTRVPIADLHRTIVDMLDDPAVGGGIRHAADCVAAYLRRKDRDDSTLVEYAARLGNGAIFKRLGFLTEKHPLGAALAGESARRLSGGHSDLDPAQKGGVVVAKWRLRIPTGWQRGDPN